MGRHRSQTNKLKGSTMRSGGSKSKQQDLLGERFITSLLKEKAEGEQKIRADNLTTQQFRDLQLQTQSVISGEAQETEQQRTKRHMLYLKHLMSSENEQMKRKLQDLIDNIFGEEKHALEDDMEKCNKEIKRWELQNKEPVNFDVVIINKLNNLEMEEKEQATFRDQMAGCDTVTLQKGKLMDLSDLCT